MTPIPGFEGRYAITESGRIWSFLTNKWLRPGVTSGGYYLVVLRNHGASFGHTIHTLVAKTFLPNPDNRRVVNHLDGNKLNNELANLEWATDSENLLHSYRQLNRPAPWTNKTGQANPGAKPVEALNPKTGEIRHQFAAMMDAHRAGFDFRNVSACCNKKRNTYQGLIWRFAE